MLGRKKKRSKKNNNPPNLEGEVDNWNQKPMAQRPAAELGGRTFNP